MKNNLPDISNRSYTPVSTRGKDFRSFPISNIASVTNSARNISLSPIRSSGSHNSNEVTFNLRTVSDELKPISLDKDPLIRRFNSLINAKPNSSSRLHQKIILERIHNYHDVVDALFTMYNCEKGRILALHLVQLFVGLGYSEDCEILVEIFRNITEGQPFNVISFSKSDLTKICEDSKTENILRSIIRELKRQGYDNTQKIHNLINVIKK